METEAGDDSMIELGGNIELVGFKEFDYSEMVVIKKIVGNYAKKMSETCRKFERLTITCKNVHKQEDNEKYEVHGKVVDNGKIFASEDTEKNFYVALDNVLKKLLVEISKDREKN